MRRLSPVLAMTASIACLTVSVVVEAAPAGAQAPTHDSFSSDFGPSISYDICSFPVSGSGHADFVVSDSEQHFLVHASEQNSYTANGHTLVGVTHH